MRILPEPKFALTRLSWWLVLLLCAVQAAVAADPPDLTLGTWKLNVAKSKFVPGPPFQSETRTYAPTPGGVKVSIRTIDGNGKTITSEYPANYDGQFHQVTTSGGPADAIALTRKDAWTSEAQLKHGDIVVATARRVVSMDGKTMTITYKGSGPEGEPTDFLLFYEKQ